MKKNQWLDLASALTLISTVVLFVIAAFEHGFTRDLLLEAGVFLISVKLVLANHKTEMLLLSVQTQLDAIEKKIK